MQLSTYIYSFEPSSTMIHLIYHLSCSEVAINCHSGDKPIELKIDKVENSDYCGQSANIDDSSYNTPLNPQWEYSADFIIHHILRYYQPLFWILAHWSTSIYNWNGVSYLCLLKTEIWLNHIMWLSTDDYYFETSKTMVYLINIYHIWRLLSSAILVTSNIDCHCKAANIDDSSYNIYLNPLWYVMHSFTVHHILSCYQLLFWTPSHWFTNIHAEILTTMHDLILLFLERLIWSSCFNNFEIWKGIIQ